VATADDKGGIQLRDISDWSEHELGPTSDSIRSLALHPGGKFLASAGVGPRIRLWDVRGGREVCSLFSFPDGTWAVGDGTGRYDASNAGRVNWLHWVVKDEVIALDQLKERYYEPGLLAKLIGTNKEPLRDVTALAGVELYPQVGLTAPKDGDSKLTIQLTDRGGGIGKVVVTMNGKEIASDAQGSRRAASGSRMELALDLSNQPFLKPGEDNLIEVRALNREGNLSSRGVKARYRPAGTAPTIPLEFWAIVAGVSDYAGDDLHLQYAAKDAEDMALALRIGAQRLFGQEHTHGALLTTSGSPGAVIPTRANLQKAFEAARTAKPRDVLMVYLSGHGVTYGGPEGDYYYLTQEARTGDLTDPVVRAGTAVSSAELAEWIREVPATKQGLVLDTCGAGRAVERMAQRREIAASQLRSLERMQDRTGLYILGGSAADAASYEASRYAQGILTYSLLLGMRGAALRESQFVDVSKWFEFATDEVPRLAKDIGGIQKPTMAMPGAGSSFDIGQLLAKDEIPMAAERPLFLRSNFQEETGLQDRLKLALLVDEALRAGAARGQSGSLVYVDASDIPDAYSLAGRYRVTGGDVSVTASLFHGEQVAGSFTVAGKGASLDKLARDIVAQAELWLKK